MDYYFRSTKGISIYVSSYIHCLIIIICLLSVMMYFSFVTITTFDIFCNFDPYLHMCH